MNISTALELLYYQGSLIMEDRLHHPPEIEIQAYKTILLAKEPEVNNLYFIHQPSKIMILMPTVGMKVYLYYQKDLYPYEIVKVFSEKRITIQEMSYQNNPQINPNGNQLTIRLNKNGEWKLNSLTFTFNQTIK